MLQPGRSYRGGIYVPVVVLTTWETWEELKLLTITEIFSYEELESCICGMQAEHDGTGRCLGMYAMDNLGTFMS